MQTGMQNFSPNGEHFACVTQDNRLRLYDCLSGELRQEYVEKDHLERKYTCIAWGDSNTAAGKKGAKRKTASASLGVVALGNADGSITIWDLAEGKPAHLGKRGDGHGSSVRALAIFEGMMYSGSEDKMALEWKLSEGKCQRKFKAGKYGVQQLAVSNNSKLLATGSTNITLIDLGTGKKKKGLKGNSTTIISLVFAGSRYLCAAASSSRFVNLYDVESDGDKPAHVFTCDSSPLQLSAIVASFTKQATNLHLLATTAKGDVKLWKYEVRGSSGKKSDDTDDEKIAAQPADGMLVLKGAPEGAGAMADAATSPAKKGKKGNQLPDKAQLTSTSKKNLALIHSSAIEEGRVDDVLAACFSGSSGGFSGGDDARLLMARGSPAAPTFEPVEYQEDGEIMAQVAVTYVASGDHAGVGNPLDAAAAAAGGVEIARTKRGDVGHMEKLPGSRETSMAMDADDPMQMAGESQELTLGERVAALTGDLDFSIKAGESAADTADGKNAKKGGKKGKNGKNGKTPLPQAGSLTSVLEQAMHAGDETLLEHALSSNDAKVVNETVRKLGTVHVLPFLQLVVARFERRPTRGAHLSNWIQAVLVHHTAYLMTVGNLPAELGGFYKVVESRLSHFQKFLKLSGRLELILSQVDHNKAKVDAEAASAPVSVYNEEDDGDDSDEDDDDDDDEADGNDDEGDEDEEDEEEDDEDDEDE